MEKKYFGQGCEWFCGQWEMYDNEKTCEPVLCYCNHKENKDDYEGNCTYKLCPLKNKGD